MGFLQRRAERGTLTIAMLPNYRTNPARSSHCVARRTPAPCAAWTTR